MRTRVLPLLLALALLAGPVGGLQGGLAASLALGGSTVRGYLYRVAPDGQGYAAPGVPVRLWHPAYGPSVFAASGTDGMYYLYGVPPGDFTLEVWVLPQVAQRYAVRVSGAPVVDVPPIRVP